MSGKRGAYRRRTDSGTRLPADVLSFRDPSRDPWPSVPDPDESDACEFCEAMPDEPHAPSCHLYAPSLSDLAWCDRCQQEFATTCACDGHCEEE
jgi:hypothetical protein